MQDLGALLVAGGARGPAVVGLVASMLVWRWLGVVVACLGPIGVLGPQLGLLVAPVAIENLGSFSDPNLRNRWEWRAET